MFTVEYTTPAATREYGCVFLYKGIQNYRISLLYIFFLSFAVTCSGQSQR